MRFYKRFKVKLLTAGKLKPLLVYLSRDLIGSGSWVSNDAAEFSYESKSDRWVLSCEFNECTPDLNYHDGFIDLSISIKTQTFEKIVDKQGNIVDITLGPYSGTEIAFTSRLGSLLL